ncbi:MAG: hypothetical protein V4669_05235 [Pseudomonadota bacterium]
MAEPSSSRIALVAGGLVALAALAVAVALVVRPDGADASRPEVAAAVEQVTDPSCRIDPIVKRAGAGDGSAVQGATASGSALIVKGKEAAAAGRDRDAEVAFLAACKLEPPQPGAAATLARADAKYNLGRHYASLAQEGAANRGELSARAAILLHQSLAVYQAQLGAEHEKVKFAAQAISVLQGGQAEPARSGEQVAAVAPPPAVTRTTPASATQPATPSKANTPSQPNPPVSSPTASVAPATSPKPLRKASEPDRTVVATARPKPAAPAPRTAAMVAERPSFDCARARSVPEKIICSDSELARMDRDLGRVYARAKRAADDPRQFQRESDREWRRREAECRDRECLVDWYLDRRAQLTERDDDDEDWRR